MICGTLWDLGNTRTSLIRGFFNKNLLPPTTVYYRGLTVVVFCGTLVLLFKIGGGPATSPFQVVKDLSRFLVQYFKRIIVVHDRSSLFPPSLGSSGYVRAYHFKGTLLVINTIITAKLSYAILIFNINIQYSILIFLDVPPFTVDPRFTGPLGGNQNSTVNRDGR